MLGVSQTDSLYNFLLYLHWTKIFIVQFLKNHIYAYFVFKIDLKSGRFCIINFENILKYLFMISGRS